MQQNTGEINSWYEAGEVKSKKELLEFESKSWAKIASYRGKTYIRRLSVNSPKIFNKKDFFNN